MDKILEIIINKNFSNKLIKVYKQLIINWEVTLINCLWECIEKYNKFIKKEKIRQYQYRHRLILIKIVKYKTYKKISISYLLNLDSVNLIKWLRLVIWSKKLIGSMLIWMQ
jgi:hypothetical protein